jgi:hypothetical protein
MRPKLPDETPAETNAPSWESWSRLTVCQLVLLVLAASLPAGTVVPYYQSTSWDSWSQLPVCHLGQLVPAASLPSGTVGPSCQSDRLLQNQGSPAFNSCKSFNGTCYVCMIIFGSATHTDLLGYTLTAWLFPSPLELTPTR